MDNFEAQSDEFLALESIFDNKVFTPVDELGIKGGQFDANLQLTVPFHVVCKLPDAETPPLLHEIEHLPPVVINFKLPLDYPSHSPPNFTLSCKWLMKEQLSLLCSKLDRIWDEHKGEVVLFHWFQFLLDESQALLAINDSIEIPIKFSSVVGKTKRKEIRQFEAGHQHQQQHEQQQQHQQHQHQHHKHKRENDVDDRTARRSVNTKRFHDSRFHHRKRRNDKEYFEPTKKSLDPRAIQELPPDTSLLPIILDFDQERRLHVFNSSFFTCKICFEEKIGSQCLAFKGCNHVFCRACIKSYFEVQIISGNVHNLNCADDKCSSQALPTQVRDLVSSELFAKYDRLLLSSTLDTMADIVYCPRTLCQCAVLVEPNSTMANCPACLFAFCILCKRAYHGVVPCRIKAADFKILYEEYEKATEDEKQAMEKRYGRHQLQNVVQNVLSEDWVVTNSKRCPHCNTPIEKLDGCNKMTCVHCNCYFCWLCMTRLNKSDPYAHYNNSTSTCVNLLFQGVDSNSDEEPDFGEFL